MKTHTCYAAGMFRKRRFERSFGEAIYWGPETCGWTYVEGLRKGSSSDLALFWDKEGLGHNGERLPEGGHVVTFVNGTKEHIPESEWSEFLVEQRDLLAEEKRRAR